LQITNILRDVGEDRCCRRVYLPMDEMAAFGLTEANIGLRVKGKEHHHYPKASQPA